MLGWMTLMVIGYFKKRIRIQWYYCYCISTIYLSSFFSGLTSSINNTVTITACNGVLHLTNKKILVIGGVAAGTSAASKAKRIDPDADVRIIQDEKQVSYGACGMPYVIGGKVKDFQELIERPADVFKKKYQIDVITNSCARKIDRVKKEVHAIDLQSGIKTIYGYDSLVVATGARAILPNIKGINQKDGGDCSVFLIRNYEDGRKIYDSAKTKKASTCVIVGAGLVGLEMLEAFKKRSTGRKMDITVVEKNDHLLPTMLDKQMATIVQKELEDNEVKVITGERVEELVGSTSTNGDVKTIRTNTNRQIDTDFILLGTGVRPNSEIAKDADIELGFADAIKVDEYMRTSIPDIFAAGDCATARSYITNEDTYLPLGTTANRQGRVAGENAAGGSARFRGIAGSVITKVFGLYIGKTGLIKEEALNYGFDPIEEDIKSITRARYYPDNKSIWIKIIADRKSGRILGSQIVGGEGVKERIDLIALAILLKADIRDLASYDACYVPPASPVWEPVNIAASQTAKVL
jgi:NADPH-dependent 2,4-dienoyl-CoA reductase/sulfur reductase-like enzyme